MEPYNFNIKQQPYFDQYYEEPDEKLLEAEYIHFLKNPSQQYMQTHLSFEQEQPQDPLERTKVDKPIENMAKGVPTISDVMRELLEIKQEIHQVKLINEGLKVQQKELVKIIAENSVLVKRLRQSSLPNPKGISFRPGTFPINTKENLYKLEADLEHKEKEINIKRNSKVRNVQLENHESADKPDLLRELKSDVSSFKYEEIQKVPLIVEKTSSDLFCSKIENKYKTLLNIEDFNNHKKLFPVVSKAALLQLEAALELHEEYIVNEMKKIVGDAKLKRVFDRLFTLELMLQFNLRGVQNKDSFEKLRNINAALYKVLYKEGYSQDEYLNDVRESFKLLKNRFHKINHSIRKRESIY